MKNSWFGLLVVLVLVGSTYAGDEDHEWSISDVCVPEGTLATPTFTFDITGDAIAGYQMAACHDAEALSLEEVRSLDLGEPKFESVVDDEADGYWYVGVVFSLGADDTLEEGGDAFEADYRVLSGPGVTEIEICEDGLDDDGLSVIVGVDTVAAFGGTGTVKIVSALTYRITSECGGYDDASGVGQGSICVAIEDARGDDAVDVNGFTIALANDDDEIIPVDGREGAGLDDPDYFSVNVTDRTCVAAVIYDFTDFTVAQSFGEATVVLEVDYETNADFEEFDGMGDPVITEITFEDTDIIYNQLASIVDGDVITVDPLLEDGSIEWLTSCTGSFLRGDCDGNGNVFPILDALYVLEYGFTDGPAPPCLAAADCDGNGTVFPILEALYVLEYGFTNGPAPPDPGPTECGTDTNMPGPGCETPPDSC